MPLTMRQSRRKSLSAGRSTPPIAIPQKRRPLDQMSTTRVLAQGAPGPYIHMTSELPPESGPIRSPPKRRSASKYSPDLPPRMPRKRTPPRTHSRTPSPSGSRMTADQERKQRQACCSVVHEMRRVTGTLERMLRRPGHGLYVSLTALVASFGNVVFDKEKTSVASANELFFDDAQNFLQRQCSVEDRSGYDTTLPESATSGEWRLSRSCAHTIAALVVLAATLARDAIVDTGDQMHARFGSIAENLLRRFCVPIDLSTKGYAARLRMVDVQRGQSFLRMEITCLVVRFLAYAPPESFCFSDHLRDALLDTWPQFDPMGLGFHPAEVPFTDPYMHIAERDIFYATVAHVLHETARLPTDAMPVAREIVAKIKELVVTWNLLPGQLDESMRASLR